MRRPGHLVTREMAEEHLWSDEHLVASNVVDVYIRRLRRKIDDPFDEKLLETVRGLATGCACPGGQSMTQPRPPPKKRPSFIHSIRFRLVLWFTAILALVLAAFSIFIYYNQSATSAATRCSRWSTAWT